MPVSVRIASTCSTRSAWPNWRADRLTDISRRGPSGRASRHFVAWRQAVSSTHRPSGMIRPVSSASGMKAMRRDETADRVLPAHERLEADDPVRGQVDQRLVVDPQLAALDRPPEVVLHVDPVHRLVGHRGLEDGVPAGRVGLGPDHRDLGLAEHLARRRPARPADGDAQRGADEPLPAAHREGRAQLVADALGDPPGVLDVDDRVEDDPELVAAEAGDRVARAERPDQPLADRRQEPVADGVADALVDDLEPVEVEQDDRHRVGTVGLGRQGVRDPLGQELAVREAGRRVVEGAALGRVEQP